MIRTFLVDDHELIRRGIREILESESDIEVVGEWPKATGAVDAIIRAAPHVAVLDVGLPDGDGIEICRDLATANPSITCLILTSYSDDEALYGAILAGAAGYLMKQIGGTDLVGSIRRAAAGESLLDPHLVALAHERLSTTGVDGRISRLSPRERSILDLIVAAKTNQEIADTLFLSERTVRNYVSRLLTKLGMRHRTEAAVYALRANRPTPRTPRPPG